jgi:hypothetical protein
VWAKTHQGALHLAVRAQTSHWVAVMFKDFPATGMLGDFNDVKLLTTQGIEDRFLATQPGAMTPGPRKRAGVHT